MNSWKEIARYLGRGVRTVQRWEQELRLPVHRIGKGRRSPVYAVVSELKFWMVTSGGKYATRLVDGNAKTNDSGGSKREAELAARLRELVHAVAEASVRQQRQTEALEKRIIALRSQISRNRPPKS